jgi:hypothetical protein
VIGHALLAERILATVFVSRYENNRKLYFSVVWFTLLVGFFYFFTLFFARKLVKKLYLIKLLFWFCYYTPIKNYYYYLFSNYTHLCYLFPIISNIHITFRRQSVCSTR